MASTAATSESYSNLPLTPRDSDIEDPSESSQMAGRKRSASEMEEDQETSKQKKTGRKTAKVPETIEAETSSDDGFAIQCPAPPQRNKKVLNDNVVIEKDAPVLAPNLTIDFSVRPGKKWSEMPRFKNAKCEWAQFYLECSNKYPSLLSQEPCRCDLYSRTNRLCQSP